MDSVLITLSRKLKVAPKCPVCCTRTQQELDTTTLGSSPHYELGDYISLKCPNCGLRSRRTFRGCRIDKEDKILFIDEYAVLEDEWKEWYKPGCAPAKPKPKKKEVIEDVEDLEW